MQLKIGVAPARAVAATGIPARIGALIRNVTGAAVAVLVVAEILVLFADVLARNVFHAPLICSHCSPPPARRPRPFRPPSF